MRIFFLLSVMLASLLACSPSDSENPTDRPDASEVTIKGEVYSPEGMTLPPGSHLSVKLLDTGPSDAYSIVIDEYKLNTTTEQMPLAFELAADADRLERLPGLSLRATVHDPHGTLVWTTDSLQPVQTADQEYQLQMVLDNLSSRRNGQTTQSASAIRDAVWVLESVVNADGGEVSLEGERPITLQLGEDGRMTGKTDCNRLTGQYWLIGDQGIRIEPLGTMLKPCPPPAEGSIYLSLLQRAEAWSMENGELILEADDGRKLIFQEIVENSEG